MRAVMTLESIPAAQSMQEWIIRVCSWVHKMKSFHAVHKIKSFHAVRAPALAMAADCKIEVLASGSGIP